MSIQPVRVFQGDVTVGAVTVVAVTIANGQSRSAAVKLDGRVPVRIDMPAGWDAAPLSFQVSTDGVTYRDLYDQYGSEYTVQVSASRAIVLPLPDLVGVNYVKVRSGTSGTPVNQLADRELRLVARVI